MTKRVRQFLIDKNSTIKQAMRCLSAIGQKQIFVVERKRHLLGALSDGDIRKWILKGGDLNEKVEEICNKSPWSVNGDYDLTLVREEMLRLRIEAVPVIDKVGFVQDVLTWDDVFAGKVQRRRDPLKIQVVIMAGGQGSRLEPFTRILPKPLIPIGDKAIIEVIMDKFHDYGINEFFVSLNYKARLIKSYFEESDTRYRIRYVQEDKPLGTIGSLKLLENKLRSSFFVTNCDVLIDADYAELVRFHQEMKADLTLTVSCRHYVIPYGVCEIESGGYLKNIVEKPEHDLLINTGLYIMSKKILSLIPIDSKCDLNELVTKAKDKGMRVVVFPVPEKSWTDVGQWQEYFKTIAARGE